MELDDLEARVAALTAQRDAGVSLSAADTELLDTLETVNRAEAAAREAFTQFYAGLASGSNQTDLPPEVAAAMAHWVEARKRWEELLAGLPPATPARETAPVRLGPRTRMRPPAAVRLPTALPAKDALAALFAPHLWKTDSAGLGLVARVSAATQVRVEFDDVLGFGPDQAVHQITKNGPAAAQTFLAMAALWHERLGDADHETYLTVYASDLLRFQGKRETPKGGYHRDDLLAKGRDIYLLSRISVPHATVRSEGNATTRTLSIGRLLSLEALEAVSTDAPGLSQSVVKFRYHLSQDAHAWIEESRSQVAPKLLSYHPLRQKYQILFGFCLAWADATLPAHGERQVALPTLLQLAAIPVPDRRIAEFLSSIEDALAELARDGVVPGVRLVKPDHWTELLAARRARQIIEESVVVFPRLLAG